MYVIWSTSPVTCKIISVMEGCHNCTRYKSTETLVLEVLIPFLTLVAVVTIILSIITVAGLCIAHSVAKLVRIFLVNHLVTVLMIGFVGIGFAIINGTALYKPFPPPNLWICRVLIYLFLVSNTSRLYSLAAFSVAVLFVVKYSEKSGKTFYTVNVIVLIWTISTVVSAHVLPSQFFNVSYYNNIVCFALIEEHVINVDAKYAFTAIGLSFGMVLPLLVSIAVLISVLCHIKWNRLSAPQASSYNKGMLRFVFFLVFSNVLNCLCILAFVVLIYTEEKPAVYFTYIANTVCLVPTPILVIVFLKPVRNKISLALCYYCFRPRKQDTGNQTALVPLIE